MTILGIWGEDKTGKSTLALTFPKPMVFMEFDVGGYERAKVRFHTEIAQGLITYQAYVMPFQFGTLDSIQLTVRPSKIVVGLKELFYKFLANYVKALEDESVKTVVIDTGTLLWEVVCTSYIQEKQELQMTPDGHIKPNEKLRVSLLPIEYREPNIRMRGIIYQAKAHNKHLVLTHHSRDEYGLVLYKGEMVEQKTGKKERSGWNPLGDGADIIVHTYWNSTIGKPCCDISLSYVPATVGINIEEPSFEKIMQVSEMMRGVI